MCIFNVVTVSFIILHTVYSADNTDGQNTLSIDDFAQSQPWDEEGLMYHDLPSECRQGNYKYIKYTFLLISRTLLEIAAIFLQHGTVISPTLNRR